jgi:Flp pilus assembly pilin Flp
VNLFELHVMLLALRERLPARNERGAGAVEYVLILIGAVAIAGVAIFAVTQFVTSKGNELNGK